MNKLEKSKKGKNDDGNDDFVIWRVNAGCGSTEDNLVPIHE